MRFRLVVFCLMIAALSVGCGTNADQTVAVARPGKQQGYAHGGQQPITGAVIQLWRINSATDGGLGTAMLTGTVTSSDGSGNASNSNANAGNQFNSLPAGYFNISGAYQCPPNDALVYITASGGNPGLSAGSNNPQSQMVTALGSCNNLKSNVQTINISEQTTVGTVAALYPFMSAYNAIGASPAHAADIAALFPLVNEYVDFQAGTAPGPALPAGYSASTADLHLEANVLATCVNSTGGTYNDGSVCGTLFADASPTSFNNPSSAPTDVTAAALAIRTYYTQSAGSIATLPAPQAPFQPSSVAHPPDWTLPIFQLPPAPTFSLSPGTYSGTQQLRMQVADPNAAIYYAFGGATPSISTLSYSGPILVSSSETVNAITIAANGRASSTVSSATYTITGVSPNAPTVSLALFSSLQVGSTTPITVQVQSNAAGSVVAFNTSGPVGGSFSPATCTITNGSCRVSYLPTGTVPAGTYTNGLTASFGSAGTYNSTSASTTVLVQPVDTLTPLAKSGFAGRLIQAADGYFYGVAPNGGTSIKGLIYKTDSSGNVTSVYNFTGASDGSFPNDRLVQGSDGFFYGVAPSGGPGNNGTIFKVDTAGNFTLLYSFTGSLDGAQPTAALIQATDGSFYGTTFMGGMYGNGTVYKIDAAGNFTLLHAFNKSVEGGSPHAGLLQATDGMFYGTTGGGGTYQEGTVYRMDSSGNVTTLYSFTGGTDGSAPFAALMQATDGQFYGTTALGGFNATGTVFKIDSSGNFATLYIFNNPEGYFLQGALVQAADGAFYGTTSFGGSSSLGANAGTIYKVDSAGNFTLLYNFFGSTDGRAPYGGVIQGSDGSFYGTTNTSIFQFTPSPSLPGPVTLNVPASVTHGTGFTLTYTVSNASSQTMQRCFATNNAGDVSGWAGVITASTTPANATLTAPATPGTYNYTLTCGGVESGFVTLNVN